MGKLSSMFEALEDDFTPAQREKIKQIIKDELQLNVIDRLQLNPLSVEPEKRRTGLIAYADGTNWDPGAGEGTYQYDSGGTWKQLF